MACRYFGETHSPAGLTASRTAFRIELDKLKPFATAPEGALTFSDLHAVFGTDLHTTQQIIRVLRDAQLVLRRDAELGAKPTIACDRLGGASGPPCSLDRGEFVLDGRAL